MPGSFRIPLASFVATVGAILIALGSFVVWNRDKMPAPRISESVAFNEKALWLRHALNANPSPEIIVVGSSMGLNNIEGETLAGITGTSSILNTSSWGLSISDSCRLLEELLKSLHPKMVIVVAYFGDFQTSRIHQIDWNAFDACLWQTDLLPLYLKNPDFFYYKGTYSLQNSQKNKAREIYSSLYFDSFGGVPLSNSHFSYDSDRWSAYQDPALVKAPFDPAAALALSDVLKDLQRRKIAALVVICPMREVAEKALSAQLDDLLWNDVHHAAQESNASFVQIPNKGDFSDAEFVDAFHLNQDGARQMTRELAPAIRQLSGASFPAVSHP